jgi:hypothetical protein
MLIFKKSIPRRTFLRGAGASLALPFLDAMIPALAAGKPAQPPLRLGYIYLPIGRIMSNWTPATEGTDYELTPSLEPLARFRDQMLLLSGMDLKSAHLLPDERGGPHARPCAAFLTGVHPFPDRVGTSFDQRIANHIGHDTPLASLELSLDSPDWAGQGGGDYDGFYTSTISWRTANSPLPVENNPRKIFERLFGDTDTLDPEAMRRRIQRKGSVLDSVSARVNSLMTSVSANDRYKLEEYLGAVRDIERGIQASESRTVSENDLMPGIKRPTGIPDNYLELGAQDGHHSLSHHKGDTGAIELVKKIDRYQSEMLVYFLDKMQSVQESDGTTLLDNSVIVAASGLSDANEHVHTNVPAALFGRAQGRIRGGRHVRHDGVPFSNLNLAIMDMFGASAEEYLSDETSDGTGILKGLA